MQSLKLSALLLAILSLGACDEATNSISTRQSPEKDGPESVSDLFKSSMKGIETTRYHEYIHAESGLVQARYPIPKTWKVNSINAPVYMEGPDGLKVYKTEIQNYAWSNNPMMQQTLQMAGQQLAQPMSTRQILNQFIQPDAESQGYRLLQSYPLPNVAGLWEQMIHAMPNTGSQRQVEALGTEWEHTGQGTRSFILLVRYQTMNQQSIIWNIQTTELEAPPGNFDKAKDAYIYSLANAQLNPQWIQHMNGQLRSNIQKSNQFWAEASAQSAAIHQQRMSAIAARSSASTSIGNTYSDILDISHKGFLDRSSINDAGHDRTIRSISGTALIGNHETGEHYNVPSGSNFYWVSNDGTYIGTDNSLFNPNTDQRTKDKDWTKFAVEK